MDTVDFISEKTQVGVGTARFLLGTALLSDNAGSTAVSILKDASSAWKGMLSHNEG